MPIPRGNVPAGAAPAAKALEVVKAVYRDPNERANFRQNPQATFDRKKANVPGAQNAIYAHIPAQSRGALEQASDAEMDFLFRLDRALVADDLCVDVPSPGTLHYF
jgi:hypothetical protein